MSSGSRPVLYALILAGGRGARFWPLSRRARPKQCQSLSGGRTLVQQTLDRLAPLIPPERVFVVTGPDMAPLIRDQLPEVPPAQILVEPTPRNTAPCIAWGADVVARAAGRDAIVAVLPSDHAIGDAATFRAGLECAAGAAAGAPALVTLGIRPDRPATGYGYVELDEAPAPDAPVAARVVRRFVEKPDAETARDFLDGGRHLWNAGVFVFSVETLRGELGQHLPRTAEALAELREGRMSLREAWAQTDATSIDYGVLERSDAVLTVPCDPGWSDLGSWEQVGDWLPEAPGGRGRARRIVAVDSEGCVVHALDKAVALVGLQDLIVVDTPDALLVLDPKRAQDVREVLDQIEALGLEDLL